MPTFIVNSFEGSQKTRFLQLERQYRLYLLGLSLMKRTSLPISALRFGTLTSLVIADTNLTIANSYRKVRSHDLRVVCTNEDFQFKGEKNLLLAVTRSLGEP